MKVYLAMVERNQVESAILDIFSDKETAFDCMKKAMLKLTKLPSIKHAVIEKVDNSSCPYVYYADKSKSLGFYVAEWEVIDKLPE